MIFQPTTSRKRSSDILVRNKTARRQVARMLLALAADAD
jgi:hypothetical protein